MTTLGFINGLYESRAMSERIIAISLIVYPVIHQLYDGKIQTVCQTDFMVCVYKPWQNKMMYLYSFIYDYILWTFAFIDLSYMHWLSS